MQLYFTINAPHQWVIIDQKGVRDSGTADNLKALPLDLHHERIVAVVPGEQVITRTVTVPVKNRQKILSAIPFAVEESLIGNVDDLHFSLMHIGREYLVTFAYVARSLIEGWLKQLDNAGLSVDSILPDYLLLPYTDNGATTLVRADAGRILVRAGTYLGAAIDQQTLPIWLENHDLEKPIRAGDLQLYEALSAQGASRVTEQSIGPGLVDWLQGGALYDGPDLLQGDFQPSRKDNGLKRYRLVAAVILLAVLIRFAGDISELVWLNNTHQQLDSKTTALYQDLFPGAKLISGKARVQMKNKLEALRQQYSGSEFTVLLASTARLLKDNGAKVEELQFKGGVLTAVCTMNDFSHMDKVKQAFTRDTSINTRLVQSGAKGSRVQARFEISAKKT